MQPLLVLTVYGDRLKQSTSDKQLLYDYYFLTSHTLGVITQNQIPLTTIVTYLPKKLQKQNFKPLGNYTCMQSGASHLQTVQENILSHIILATYKTFTMATVRFTQNVSCNIYTHPIYQQKSLCNNSSDNKNY